jgi:hypothetical protein
MDVDFAMDDIPHLTEELESDFFDKDEDVIMAYFEEIVRNENNKRPRSDDAAAGAKENDGPNTPPFGKRHRAEEALDVEMADIEDGMNTPDPYPADFEACADCILEQERTKHGIEEDLDEASIPTDLLSLQSLGTHLVPDTFAVPIYHPVSNAAAPVAVATAPAVVADSSGVATTGSAINNSALPNGYPRRQRNAVERWVDRVPTPPKRRPSRQKKAKAASVAVPSVSSAVLAKRQPSAATRVIEDNRRSKDIECILSAVQKARKQRSARNVVANADCTAFEGGPLLMKEGLSDDSTVVYIDVGINREDNIDFVLSAALKTRRDRKGAPRRPRQFSVAPTAIEAATETVVAQICISEKENSNLSNLPAGEQQPTLLPVVEEEPAALEAPKPLAGKPKPKSIVAQHAALVNDFPADLVVLEKDVLDFSRAYQASGNGYFTPEILNLKQKKERHTARLLVIQDRLKWVEGELLRDGNSYGWKGGVEPAAGTYELYRGIALKFMRDRLNYMRSQEFRNGADKRKKAAKDGTAKATKSAAKQTAAAAINKRKSKK